MSKSKSKRQPATVATAEAKCHSDQRLVMPNEPVNDIWKDPNVKAALKDGRPAEDIAVLSCPRCGRWGYYNQGSHFWCRFCKQGWHCCTEGEEPPCDRQYLYLDGFTSLADTVTVTTEGYDNMTLPNETAH